MRLFVSNKGERIVRRPNSMRCRYVLSNGQLLTVYFNRYRNRGRVGSGIRYVWLVAVHIGNGRREANRWHDRGAQERTQRQTGTCGLEGMTVALRYVLAFANHFIGPYEELQVGWADDKRRRAYRYILRYPGFIMHEVDGKHGGFIAYRNPDIYEWIENKEAASDV